ncbi:MAG: nucleotidyltransferase family protein [Bacteroidetes bacterium]|nr:nucleotidyltransferase family protein [Bacteroidota bacterium]
MIHEAIILAGGRGTRLHGVIDDLPKPMALVNGRPFLEYLLRYLKKQGVQKVVLAVGYKSEKITEYFKSEYQGISIKYSVEHEPLGTGGGLVMALKYVSCSRVFVLNGDSFFDVDLDAFAKFSSLTDSPVCIALAKVNDTGRYGSVDFGDDGRIHAFSEKNSASGPGYINGGIYHVKRIFFQDLNLKGRFSLERDVFEHYCTTVDMFGYPCEKYFIDIGLPEDYLRAQDELTQYDY